MIPAEAVEMFRRMGGSDSARMSLWRVVSELFRRSEVADDVFSIRPGQGVSIRIVNVSGGEVELEPEGAAIRISGDIVAPDGFTVVRRWSVVCGGPEEAARMALNAAWTAPWREPAWEPNS